MVPWYSAFIVGGILCLIGQLVMDLTKAQITPGHILVGYITSGAILSGLGLYQPLVEIGGAGATIPLSGFGHLLTQGTLKAVEQKGLLGAFSGGIEAAAAGITAAVIFGYIAAVIFNPKG
ncbi:stage V sporulation protein AE [Thermosyntropha lipolytica DSM 11003]|uniref:Stage V sporulation protein AE n=1 Tax=Thermosyntropha lipolytica DSM 11003 TaxID=1123382 RepID=A0A1M5M487_9FIRM|nr:stage V sporulation protein AE [Thermosyntropha lipolytica]SHG71709.1 stage V sporulation protein AE [Thermosyntropha lipolytica DSM 11003]